MVLTRVAVRSIVIEVLEEELQVSGVTEASRMAEDLGCPPATAGTLTIPIEEKLGARGVSVSLHSKTFEKQKTVEDVVEYVWQVVKEAEA
jgi:acyl carrier protein